MAKRVAVIGAGPSGLVTVNNSAAPWVFQIRNPADEWKKRVYRAVFLPSVIVDKCGSPKS